MLLVITGSNPKLPNNNPTCAAPSAVLAAVVTMLLIVGFMLDIILLSAVTPPTVPLLAKAPTDMPIATLPQTSRLGSRS